MSDEHLAPGQSPGANDTPQWLFETLGIPAIEEGAGVTLQGQDFVVRGGMLRSRALLSEAQKQTEETFGFKWKKRETFESEASLKRMREWLIERYGDLSRVDWLSSTDTPPVVLDAGCGAAMSALELFGPVLERIRYIGLDVSEAVDVARTRFQERGRSAAFMQADIVHPPFPDESIDIVFSEGVLHHTDSTRGALEALAPKVKRGGRLMFYVYRRKGPVREFTDDYIRDKLQAMEPEEAWNAMSALTKLGKVLGELGVEVDVPEEVSLLEIPAGRIDLQRLFYWHVFKAFYHPDLDLEEMNHINFDWYAPRNAHRQSLEEVRQWCREAALGIEREVEEEAGITIIARRL